MGMGRMQTVNFAIDVACARKFDMQTREKKINKYVINETFAALTFPNAMRLHSDHWHSASLLLISSTCERVKSHLSIVDTITNRHS